MSGPSATAKPRSPKIAVISSITWLIGWMRPRSAGAWRTGSVTSTFSAASRAAIAASRNCRPANGKRLGHPVLEPVDRRALQLPLGLAHRAQRLQHLGDRALLAERGHPHRLDRRLVGGSGDVGHQRLLQRDQLIVFVNGEIHVVISVLGLSRSAPVQEKPAPALPARVSQIHSRRSLGRRWLGYSAFKSIRRGVLQIFERGLGLGHQGGERHRLVDRQVRQDLAVDLDAGLARGRR